MRDLTSFENKVLEEIEELFEFCSPEEIEELAQTLLRNNHELPVDQKDNADILLQVILSICRAR